jgi:hypothetical protein
LLNKDATIAHAYHAPYETQIDFINRNGCEGQIRVGRDGFTLRFWPEEGGNYEFNPIPILIKPSELALFQCKTLILAEYFRSKHRTNTRNSAINAV